MEDVSGRKTIHIIKEGGRVAKAFVDRDIDVIIYDLDCEDPFARREVEEAVAQLAASAQEL